MGKSIGKKGLFCLLICSALIGTLAFAGPGGPGGPGGRRGGFDRQAMQQRMLEMMKERMEVSDEEWTVIAPRLQEVMTIQGNAMSGRMRGFFGRGRRGRDRRDDNPQASDPVEVATDDLQDTLDKEEPTTAEIKAKLAALRGAREKNKQKLVNAQQKLKEVLSVKQEAMLVMMCILE